MSFDIHLSRVSAAPHEDNHPLFRELLVAFPELADEQLDLRALHAGEESSVSRGIGLSAGVEQGDFWTTIGLWDRAALLSLPNFPDCGIEAGLARVQPYLAFLLERGFAIDVPSDVHALLAAYEGRQREVQTVAELTGGTRDDGA